MLCTDTSYVFLYDAQFSWPPNDANVTYIVLPATNKTFACYRLLSTPCIWHAGSLPHASKNRTPKIDYQAQNMNSMKPVIPLHFST